MSKFFFKEFEVEHIVKTRLKHSYLSIDKNLQIVVKTPKVSQKFITQLLLKKETWLRKQYLKILKNRPQKTNLKEDVLLFGEIVNITSHQVLFLHTKLQKLKSLEINNIVKAHDSFYKYVAQEYLPRRIKYFSLLMNLEFEKIKYRKMKRRWGSCSSIKELTFNTQLMKVKKELIDYVIVHELAHLKHMNHSKAFHLLVEKYLPNSKQLRQELKNIQINE